MNIQMKYGFYHEMGRLYQLPNDHEINLVERLHKIGKLVKKHKRLCEQACNTADALCDTKIDAIERRIEKMLDQMNIDIQDGKHKFHCLFQHDPRGNTARIFLHEVGIQPEQGQQLWAVLQ